VGDDYINGGNGNDKLRGGAGDDRVIGGNGHDNMNGNFGNDFMSGGKGNDAMRGAAGNDVMDGNEGRDNMFGDDGSDILNGGAGDDKLTGGNGADIFVFDEGNGADTVRDFDTAEDQIWITRSIDYFELSELSQVGADAVFDFGGGDTLTLLNTSVGDLALSNFVLTDEALFG